ncbi:hypothetical protein CONLIGDRAFT_627643 [Coniochaeta ligniaria NRRL 30616]|uniref:Uncharacterized protein n=1 Tax=Coniochaeta ligniaria NRRL 30616 TaxID=1408157 RepID=A0A1J7JZM2_9PEZI|nr:hypothetical protein CONLIGDRAFT_627643 [Coniochaeta ligniaria NRRL 30616]
MVAQGGIRRLANCPYREKVCTSCPIPILMLLYVALLPWISANARSDDYWSHALACTTLSPTMNQARRSPAFTGSPTQRRRNHVVNNKASPEDGNTKLLADKTLNRERQTRPEECWDVERYCLNVFLLLDFG